MQRTKVLSNRVIASPPPAVVVVELDGLVASKGRDSDHRGSSKNVYEIAENVSENDSNILKAAEPEGKL